MLCRGTQQKPDPITAFGLEIFTEGLRIFEYVNCRNSVTDYELCDNDGYSDEKFDDNEAIRFPLNTVYIGPRSFSIILGTFLSLPPPPFHPVRESLLALSFVYHYVGRVKSDCLGPAQCNNFIAASRKRKLTPWPKLFNFFHFLAPRICSL